MLRNSQKAIGKFDIGLGLTLLLTLLIIQPFLQPGLPAAADYAIHLYRTIAYEQAWAPGVIVPRWAPNLAFGYGYPLFVFAPPLPYFLGLIFHLMGFTFETALKLVTVLSILLYAGGMYLLVRDVLDSVEAGLVGAVAYAFAPFALREVLLYGGNVPQFLAIGLFPWTLWAMTRATSHQSWSWVILSAFFYAAILLTHLFHALIFTAVVAFYSLILFMVGNRTRSKEATAPTPITLSPRRFLFRAPYLPLFTIPLGLLLSAFSWLPAFIERYSTRAQSQIYLVKSPFFVRYPHWSELIAWVQPLDSRAANPYVPLTLGVITLLLAALGLLAALRFLVDFFTFNRKALQKTQPVILSLFKPLLIIFFAVTAVASIFMTLPGSQPVWELVTILQVAEFPWRMVGLANLGLAFVAGAALLLLPLKVRKLGAALIILGQIVAVGPLLYPVTPFIQYGQATVADQINYERRSQSIGTTTLGEYLPDTVITPPQTSPLVKIFQNGQIPSRLDETSLPSGATATLLEQSATTHAYQLDSPLDFTLRLLHFDYLGWRAWLNDQTLEIVPEAETGLMLLNIPAGQHTLVVHFGETPGRVMSILLSAGTLLGLIITAAWFRSGWFRDKKSNYQTQSTSLKTGLPIFGKRNTAPGNEAPRLTVIITFTTFILIPLITFWLKPQLRSWFTIDSPAHQVLGAHYTTDIRFENGIRLVGYDLGKKVASPGDYVPIVLYWETETAPMRVNLQPFVHLDRFDDWTTISDATNYTPGDVTTESNMPTFHWDNARYIRDEHDLTIPNEAAPLAYAVRVGLIDPDQDGRLWALADGSGDTAHLTTLNIRPADRPKTLANRVDRTLSQGDDTIRLTGFEIKALTRDRLEFDLAWTAKTRPQRDYTVFAQLLDQDQNLAASFDSSPLSGAYPTSTWLADQSIIDSRYIPIGEATPGSYRLVVGLYDPLTQQRLAMTDGQDFVELTIIQIGTDRDQ